ncbi:V-type ATP synthase subunit F [Methanococcus voltae]|jgi:V/A-type H+-transporting ATPase subunit F|uniref:A-type ATP synthase subunit F n=2 Tax=Methanococcus voltae TaxID=2188 RepID=A0A8J7USB9_METVO|nr:V-type ATP synthase subunit F [Methanococcus voltae]MBP2172616.1 V/A-type H+-transporting ATPase subunit F [Methanococcus voltae]MBP2201477.1 V/A-type H+-transporting ATPase subunit F [Methanococcus voltae]MCS3922266.1 V/A-type H+-transporting ATPase subunit F [Methanococcus voltae PS]
MKIGVVGDSDMITGFRLAGLTEVYDVSNTDGALEAITKLEENKEIGLIVTTERIGESIRDSLSRMKTTIVEVPDKKGPIVRENDPVKVLVRNAVGVELK